ncbi:GNAT superfamily N-acetyltransferase [Microbacterium resistens]|uniref:GNAT superfamily N-acetyltransferase n=1 Tax=Microbacterium resistens TaxID=156977 RepID=A0ABU1SB67_9MICO|nr:GNAT family N-acetyltransferase [Microbacterium resistens]MDR6866860.1 GNAT superfamily N-acetyltransferase [Microbacterium resistens]
MAVELQVVAHGELDAAELEGLRALFDTEYLSSHGRWDPDAPYGYSPADIHVTALRGEEIVGHVGFQVRDIAVGATTVTIAGTGGVLVAPSARGTGLGADLLHTARSAMQRTPGVEFGYLGCRPEVVPFYESAGWRRIQAREHSLSLIDDSPVESIDSPILICAAARPLDAWPAGDIDLRGRPW